MKELRLSDLDKDDYPTGFFWWLRENFHIWEAFEKQALRMAAIRSRYSARTIIEVMRWNSDLADKTTLFKINDHAIPGLSRMWMAKHGDDHPKFFEMRKIK
jgi:hypothetical protein